MAIDSSYLVYGGDLMLFVVPTTGTTCQPIAFSTNAKLTVSNKARDVSSKDSGYATNKEYNRYEWTVTTDALVNWSTSGTTNSADEIYEYQFSRQKVNISFSSKSGTAPSYTIDSSKKSFTGKGVITTFDVTAQDAQNATYSITIEGDGDLTLA